MGKVKKMNVPIKHQKCQFFPVHKPKHSFSGIIREKQHMKAKNYIHTETTYKLV